ncbi:hypothetical protein [Streptomyces sp. NPDC088258]|uniref:hypothetical protein n=1 Tax=Streptomyces sp. NPDC088258 TaxID=3365849 RepID=UPI00382BC460
MHLRQVTACPQSASYTTHRRRDGRLAWQIYVCQRHRRFSGWSVPGNLRRIADDDPPVQCGTVHDHRPQGEIIVSHIEGWMGVTGHWSDGAAPDDWRDHLRAAHSYLYYIRNERLAALTEHALRLAAAGMVNDVLMLLADAETAAAHG